MYKVGWVGEHKQKEVERVKGRRRGKASAHI